MNCQWLSNLKNDPLPGRKAHLRMWHPLRPDLSPHQIEQWQPRRAAVMILWVEWQKKNPFFFLIERSRYDGVHSGQMALPGGKEEERDESLWETARRETGEELGLDPDGMEFIRQLSSVYIPVSNHTVFPFVGLWEKEQITLKPDAREVGRIIRVSLEELLDPKNVSSRMASVEGKEVRIPFFALGGSQVWGATALILSEVKAMILKK